MRLFQEYQGSILSRVIPKTQKMVPNTALLNIQHYKVRIKGKGEQFGETSSAIPNTSVYSRYSKTKIDVALDNVCQLYLSLVVAVVIVEEAVLSVY